jgi:hypothetical protein
MLCVTVAFGGKLVNVIHNWLFQDLDYQIYWQTMNQEAHKSGQTTEEAPGRMRPEQATNGLFPWKRNDDDDYI